MKRNEIEETRGTFGPIAIRALAVGAQSIGADRSRRCRAECSRHRIHSDWPTRNRTRENQTTGNWRVESNSSARH